MTAQHSSLVAAASSAVHQVLREVAPVEAGLVSGYVEVFVELTAGGELITLDRARGAGRFGEGDLWMPVVARLVVEALRRGEASWVTAQRVAEEAIRVGAPAGWAQAVATSRAIRRVLAPRPATEGVEP